MRRREQDSDCAIGPIVIPACISGMCGLGACAIGFADCNNNPADGCEVNILNDVNNCGTCGHVCTGSQKCANGACQ